MRAILRQPTYQGLISLARTQAAQLGAGRPDTLRIVVMIQSASEPFKRHEEARAAVVAIRLAELMGLYRRQPGATPDRTSLEEVVASAAEAGIGEQLALATRLRGRQRGDLASAVLEVLEASPMPRAEIPALAAILGIEPLSALTGASLASLRRYMSAARTTPDAVALRIHFVARLVAILLGSYNQFGVRRWFERPRSQLGGTTPGTLLTGAWNPEDEGPMRVARLAEALLT